MTTKASLENLRFRMRQGLRLTPGERLALHRRAHRNTQSEMAGFYGVGMDQYRCWEDDIGNVPIVDGVHTTELPLRELCFVHRRRRGITLAQIAYVLERSVSWVHGAESGRPGAEKIVDYLLKDVG